MRPRSDVLPPLLSLLSHGRRVVVVVLVEVAGTLLVGVLLPRGEVLFVGSLDLLAVFLEENEPALLTVTALWRGRGARGLGLLGLGRAEFAAASQSGRRGGARGDRDVRRRARRSRITRL